jgi:outer membrane protein OmpA-like peptidoglycan-associated protein
MTADEIVKALQANPDRPRTAQGTTATPGAPGAPSPADPGFLDLQIQFEFNSAVILEESHPLLDQVAIALNSPKLKSMNVDVEGHTDGVGSKSNNEILSARRAQSVVAYLRTAGVAPDRMRGVGKGFSELLYPFEPKSAANRRVRIRPRSP